jgi:Holliday junction resolvase-like predicted endonuclease
VVEKDVITVTSLISAIAVLVVLAIILLFTVAVITAVIIAIIKILASVFRRVSPKERGNYGETITFNQLMSQQLSDYRSVVRNVYVPYRGKYSEIDLVMITQKKIFVFEVKEYSGYIYGKIDDYNWKQWFKNGTTITFYNPIKQNRTHINALSSYLKLPKENFVSIVVFGSDAVLKQVPRRKEVYVIKRNKLIEVCRDELAANTDIIFTAEMVDAMCNNLLGLTNVDESVRAAHIESIKKHSAAQQPP